MVNESLELLKRIRQLLKDVKPEHINWDNLVIEMDAVIGRSSVSTKPKKGKPVVKPKRVKKAVSEKSGINADIDFFRGIS